MSCFFLRAEKIKSYNQLNQVYRHNYRTNQVVNADPELKYQNEELIPEYNGQDYRAAHKAHLADLGYGKKKTLRKNAVLALELLMSIPKKELTHIDLAAWKKETVDWLHETFNRNPEKFGSNVLSAVYHGDEVGNAHIHALVFPINEKGILNSYSFLNNRTSYISLQDSYAKKMKPFGLERGIEGSVAKHEDIQRFYAQLNQVLNLPIPEYSKEDTPETYQNKVRDFSKAREAAFFAQQKKLEQELIKAKSLPQRDFTIIKRNLNEAQKKIEDFEREYCPLKEAKVKVRTLNLLNEALQSMEDQIEAQRIQAELNRLVAHQREVERKKKRKKRTKSDFIERE